MPTETHLKILKHIGFNLEDSQRQLTQELGVGKVNYFLRGLIDKGFVKAGNFKRNTDKLGYLYLLTAIGIEEKASLTASFLKRNLVDNEQITLEIEQLRRDSSSF
jgi:EPS-associated MarR family transcriptional regulator